MRIGFRKHGFAFVVYLRRLWSIEVWAFHRFGFYAGWQGVCGTLRGEMR